MNFNEKQELNKNETRTHRTWEKQYKENNIFQAPSLPTIEMLKQS
jgi:hypothetical protein